MMGDGGGTLTICRLSPQSWARVFSVISGSGFSLISGFSLTSGSSFSLLLGSGFSLLLGSGFSLLSCLGFSLLLVSGFSLLSGCSPLGVPAFSWSVVQACPAVGHDLNGIGLIIVQVGFDLQGCQVLQLLCFLGKELLDQVFHIFGFTFIRYIIPLLFDF